MCLIAGCLLKTRFSTYVLDVYIVAAFLYNYRMSKLFYDLCIIVGLLLWRELEFLSQSAPRQVKNFDV